MRRGSERNLESSSPINLKKSIETTKRRRRSSADVVKFGSNVSEVSDSGSSTNRRRRSAGDFYKFGSNLSEVSDSTGSNTNRRRRSSADFRKFGSNASEVSDSGSKVSGRRRSDGDLSGVRRYSASQNADDWNTLMPTEQWNTLMPQWTRRTILRTARESLSHSKFQECETAISKFRLASNAICKGVHNTVVEHSVIDLWQQLVKEKRREESDMTQKYDLHPNLDVLLKQFKELCGELERLQQAKSAHLPETISKLLHKMNLKMLSLEKLQAMAAAHSEGYKDLKNEMSMQFDSLSKLANTLAQDLQRVQSILQEELKQSGEVPAIVQQKARFLPAVSHCLVSLGILSDSVDLYKRDLADPDDVSGDETELKRRSGSSTSGECRTGLRDSWKHRARASRGGPDVSPGGDDANMSQDGFSSSDVEEVREERAELCSQVGPPMDLDPSEYNSQISHRQEHEEHRHVQRQNVECESEADKMQEHEPPRLFYDENSIDVNSLDLFSNGCEEGLTLDRTEASNDTELKFITLDHELLPGTAHHSKAPSKVWHSEGEIKATAHHSQAPAKPWHSEGEMLVRRTSESETMMTNSGGSRACVPAVKKEFAVVKPSAPKPMYSRRPSDSYSLGDLDDLSSLQQKLRESILLEDCSTLDLMHLVAEHDAAESSKLSKDTHVLPEPSGRSAENRNAPGKTGKQRRKSREAAIMDYSLPALVGRTRLIGF